MRNLGTHLYELMVFKDLLKKTRGSLGSFYPILTILYSSIFQVGWSSTNTFDVKNCIASKALQTRSTLNARWDLPSDLLLLAIFDERF